MLQGKFSNSQILTKKNELLEIIKRLSADDVIVESGMRTYQKPIRNLSETYAGGKGAGEVRVEIWRLRLIVDCRF